MAPETFLNLFWYNYLKGAVYKQYVISCPCLFILIIYIHFIEGIHIYVCGPEFVKPHVYFYGSAMNKKDFLFICVVIWKILTKQIQFCIILLIRLIWNNLAESLNTIIYLSTGRVLYEAGTCVYVWINKWRCLIQFDNDWVNW